MPVEFEQRAPIPGFPGYEVSNFGEVYSFYSGRPLVLSPNIQGIPTVGLMWEERQYRRSVKVLVARAFVYGETEIFNTPVQLDGDRYNLRASNIVWRPRWFAWRYSHQFENFYDWYEVGPIVDIINNVEYDTVIEASVTNGELCRDIRRSLLHETPVFPNRTVYTMMYEKQPM